MKAFLVFAVAALFPFGAWAQDDHDPSIQALCRNLAEYRPVEGVEYVPGAEDVVPADIGGPRRVSADVIAIPVTVLLAQRFPTVDIPADIKLEPDVGAIDVHRDGRVTYRGFDVTSQAQVVCGYGESADGQEVEEPLKSEPEEQKEPDHAEPSQKDE